MKKTISILIGSLFLISMSSCLFEEENIFDESAAQRVNTAMEEDFNLLTSASNGWVLNYFPTSDKEGYTLLMNFNKDNTVTIAAKNNLTNNIYNSEVSLFEMIADNGPVLTFNSYNEYLHGFSVPDESHGGSQGKGLEGDYEFIIMETSPDRILLKGKKRGVKMDLRRLPENQDWKEYFTSIEQMNTLLFNSKTPKITLSIGDSIIYNLENGISHIFNALIKGGDALMDTKKIPFIVTDYGILFSRTVTLNDANVREFHLNENKNALICVEEGQNVKITGQDIVDFYTEAIDVRNLRWIMLDGNENMSPAVKTVYDKIVNGFTSKKATLAQISLRNTIKNGNLIYLETAKKQLGNLLMERETISGGIKYSFKNTFTTDMTDNGKLFYNSYDGVADLVKMLSSSFKIEAAVSPFTPYNVKLIDISNPDIWFIMRMQ